ncbi:hypothetical protein JCM17380_52630 [Desulfosporosinus burensis]
MEVWLQCRSQLHGLILLKLGSERLDEHPVQKVVAIGPGALRLVTYAEGVSMLVGIEEIEKKASPEKSYMCTGFRWL